MSDDLEQGGVLDPREEPIVLRPGIYKVRYSHYETYASRGKYTDKIGLFFTLLEPEQYANRLIPRYFNVESVGKPIGRGGKFKPSRRGKFIRFYIGLFGAPERPDRLPIRSMFGNRIWNAYIDLVASDADGEPIPDETCYSVVRDIYPFLGDGGQSTPKPEPMWSRTESQPTGPEPSPKLIQSKPNLDDVPF